MGSKGYDGSRGPLTSSSNFLRLYLLMWLTSSLSLCLECLPILRISLVNFSYACSQSPSCQRGSGAFQPASIHVHMCENYVCI